MVNKAIICLLLACVILGAGIVYPRRAHAVAGVLDVNIMDVEVIAKDLITLVVDTLVQVMKQRIIGQLTDRTVAWIQNEGDPRMIGSYYDDVLKDSFQAAVGDVAIELGYEELCKPMDWGISLQLQLVKPETLSKRVECTLDDIVANVKGGIDSFERSFTSGGWIAYQEVLKPQNNAWGVEMLTHEELVRRESERKAETEYQASVGGGFLGVKRCTKWQCKAATPWEAQAMDCDCLLYTSPSPRDLSTSRMPSSA